MIKKIFYPFQKAGEMSNDIREKVYEKTKIKPTEKRTEIIDMIVKGALGAVLIIAVINYIKSFFH